MAAHLTRDASEPQPVPPRNELLLREAVDRLRLQLDAARACVEALTALLAALESRHLDIATWQIFDRGVAVLAAYDKAMGDK